jgi:hypothetical protein
LELVATLVRCKPYECLSLTILHQAFIPKQKLLLIYDIVMIRGTTSWTTCLRTQLPSKASWVNGSVEPGRAYSTIRSLVRSRSTTRSTSLGVSTNSTALSSSSQKRQRKNGFVDGSVKRSKSSDSRPGVTNVKITADNKNNEPDRSDLHSIQEAEPDSLAGRESETFGNRIHCCLVVSPAGRPLGSHHSVRELLVSFMFMQWWVSL